MCGNSTLHIKAWPGLPQFSLAASNTPILTALQPASDIMWAHFTSYSWRTAPNLWRDISLWISLHIDSEINLTLSGKYTVLKEFCTIQDINWQTKRKTSAYTESRTSHRSGGCGGPSLRIGNLDLEREHIHVKSTSILLSPNTLVCSNFCYNTVHTVLCNKVIGYIEPFSSYTTDNYIIFHLHLVNSTTVPHFLIIRLTIILLL